MGAGRSKCREAARKTPDPLEAVEALQYIARNVAGSMPRRQAIDTLEVLREVFDELVEEAKAAKDPLSTISLL